MISDLTPEAQRFIVWMLTVIAGAAFVGFFIDADKGGIR